MGEAVIVAGIGCRRGVDVAQVVGAVQAALVAHGLQPSELSALSTAEMKREETAIGTAAQQFDVPLFLISKADLAQIEGRLLTRSPSSRKVSGSSSVSEASSLAAAGRGATLLGPRLKLGAVTCALARGMAR